MPQKKQPPVTTSRDPAYENATLLSKLTQQKKRGIFKGKTVIAFSDIDGTFVKKFHTNFLQNVRNYTSVANLIEFQKPSLARATAELTTFLDDLYIPIVAITGRHIQEVFDGQLWGKNYAEEQLPYFDLICSSLGTNIYVRQKGDDSYIPDRLYNNSSLDTDGYDRNRLYPVAEELMQNLNQKFEKLDIKFAPHDLQTNLFRYNDQKNLRLTPDQYKLTLFAQNDILDLPVLERLVTEWFNSNGFPEVQVILSTDEEKTFIDIVPFGKDHAIKYVMDMTRTDIGIVAGDSGNDKLMIMHAPTAAIIPGGARPELINEIKAIPGIKSTEYYVILPNGVPIYIEPSEAEKDNYTGPKSLQKAFEAYLHHLISFNLELK